MKKSKSKLHKAAYANFPYSPDIVDSVFDVFGDYGSMVLQYCTAWAIDPISNIHIIQWFGGSYALPLPTMLSLINHAMVYSPLTLNKIFNGCQQIKRSKPDLSLEGSLKLLQELACIGSTHEMAKCNDRPTCSRSGLCCSVCSRNQWLTRTPGWIPADWYKAAFATGGTVNDDWVVFDGIKMRKSLFDFDPFFANKYQPNNMNTKKVIITAEKPDYVEVNGKKFNLVPVEEKELTLEDCLATDSFIVYTDGVVRADFKDARIDGYPTEAIAEKVMLYGLLQSVAYKLNDGWIPKAGDALFAIVLRNSELHVIGYSYHTDRTGLPYFKSSDTAQQAISIFAKSKFDLKKLFQ